MKTIDLISGIKWLSTRSFYDLLKEMVAARLGDLHLTVILTRSVDFARLEAAMHWRRAISDCPRAGLC